MSFFYKATFEIWFGADYLCDKTFWMCLDLSLMIQPPRLMDTVILSAINIYIGKKNFFFVVRSNWLNCKYSHNCWGDDGHHGDNDSDSKQ